MASKMSWAEQVEEEEVEEGVMPERAPPILTLWTANDANIEATKTFTFDGVYDQASTTEQIYTDFGYPLVEV